MIKPGNALYFLELGIAAKNSPEFAAHQADFLRREVPGTAKRAGALALFNIGRRFSAPVMRLYEQRLDLPGYRLLGAGCESTVYTDGKDVVKIERGATSLTEAEREAIKRRKDSNHQLLTKHLGTNVVAQRVEIGSHPLAPSRRTVRTIQPYCAFTALNLFGRQVEPETVAAACSAQPGLSDALNDFIDRSFHMLEEDNHMPDTNGFNNVVLTQAPDHAPQLVLVDTTPIPLKRGDFLAERITAELGTLRQNLAEVA